MGNNFARCKHVDNFDEHDGEESLNARYYTSWFRQALGDGQFSKAYRCWRRGSSKGFALKAFKAEPGARAHAVNEIKVLRALGKHARIAQLVDSEEDVNSVRVVLELCEGGQLHERIAEKGCYEEHQAALVMRHVLEAVDFLHSKGVMHRDLKPENVLLVSRDSDTDVKVCDFGLAKMAPVSSGGPRSSSFTGSDYFLAPEIILQQEYGCEVDMWAVGVMSYAVLCGSLPFCSDDMRTTYNRIVDRQLSFEGEAWDSLSQSGGLAVSFVSTLLVRMPSQRPSAVATLQHQWIINELAAPEPDCTEEDEEEDDDDALSQQSDEDTPKSVAEVMHRGTVGRCMNC